MTILFKTFLNLYVSHYAAKREGTQRTIREENHSNPAIVFSRYEHQKQIFSTLDK